MGMGTGLSLEFYGMGGPDPGIWALPYYYILSDPGIIIDSPYLPTFYYRAYSFRLL